jgi:hypothetical protein
LTFDSDNRGFRKVKFKSILFASTLLLAMLDVSPANAQRDYMSALVESCQQEQILSQSQIDDGYYFTRSRMEGRWCIIIRYEKYSSVYEPGRVIDVQSITAKTRLSDLEFLSVTGMWMFGLRGNPSFSTLIHDFSLKAIPILGASITPYGHLENYSYGGNSRVAAPYLSTIRQGLDMVRQYPLPLQSPPF